MEESVRYNIKCPIFLETDRVIKNVISKFWKAGSKERRNYAQDILLEAKTLLSCSKHNPGDTECLNCQSILHNYLQEYEPRSFLIHSTSLN